MKKVLFSLSIIVFCGLFSLPAQAQDTSQTTAADQSIQTINLKDGTALKGHLSKVRNGFYTIETKHMGNVTIHEADLLSITLGATPAPQSTQTGSSDQAPFPGGSLQLPGQMGQMGQQLMSDPEIMGSVMSLMEDPEIMELLKDPSLMQAVMTMDPEKIQNNPAVQKLLQNPRMQAIINKAGQKTTEQNR